MRDSGKIRAEIADAIDTQRLKTATRTKGTIAAKDQAKQDMKESCRKIVRVIYAQTLTDQQLIDIGLRPHDVIPTPSPIPGAAPILEVVSVFGRQVRIKLKDASGESRGRPKFVSSAQVYSFVGANPPSGSEGCERTGARSAGSPPGHHVNAGPWLGRRHCQGRQPRMGSERSEEP